MIAPRSVLGLAGPLLLGLGLAACKEKARQSSAALPFRDDFERAELGPDWFPSGGHWTVRDGTVLSTGANNAPLFLKVDLPDDVVIEFRSRSETPLVDTKLELMTDGRAHQSGYIFILGGWKNTISAICRLDEHGQDRKERTPTAAVGQRWYAWRIEKKGGSLKWFLDGKLYMSFDDAAPLQGPGHNRMAFSNWQNEIRYDELRIYPYASAPPVRTASIGAKP